MSVPGIPQLIQLPDANRFIVLYLNKAGQQFRRDIVVPAAGSEHRKLFAVCRAFEEVYRRVMAADGVEWSRPHGRVTPFMDVENQ